jgi:peptide-methionine (R)-S-oxide reductase
MLDTNPMYNKLTLQEEDINEGKGTESPFSGEYDDFYEDGIYICKKCNAPLFTAESKFDAGCGWPAFDESYPEALKRTPDPDGQRTEVSCNNCGAHLGHEFTGEHLTDKNVRECINSLAIKFVHRDEKPPKTIDE